MAAFVDWSATELPQFVADGPELELVLLSSSYTF